MEKLALSTRNIKIPDLHFSIGSDASLFEETWNLKHSRVFYGKCQPDFELYVFKDVLVLSDTYVFQR